MADFDLTAIAGGIGSSLSKFVEAQRELDRQERLLEKQQGFAATQAEKQREFQAEESGKTRKFKALQAKADRILKKRQLDQKDAEVLVLFHQAAVDQMTKTGALSNDSIRTMMAIQQRRADIEFKRKQITIEESREGRASIEAEARITALSSKEKAKLADDFFATKTLRINELTEGIKQAALTDKLTSDQLNSLRDQRDSLAGLAFRQKVEIQKTGVLPSAKFGHQEQFVLNGLVPDENIAAKNWQSYLLGLPEAQRSVAISAAKEIAPEKVKQLDAIINAPPGEQGVFESLLESAFGLDESKDGTFPKELGTPGFPVTSGVESSFVPTRPRLGLDTSNLQSAISSFLPGLKQEQIVETGIPRDSSLIPITVDTAKPIIPERVTGAIGQAAGMVSPQTLLQDITSKLFPSIGQEGR